eukprot:8145887-Lingulodinium_polyedra.AAC.1
MSARGTGSASATKLPTVWQSTPSQTRISSTSRLRVAPKANWGGLESEGVVAPVLPGCHDPAPGPALQPREAR